MAGAKSTFGHGRSTPLTSTGIDPMLRKFLQISEG
jgi:hypothetical protein